jgi:hypothetical protein
MSVVFEDKSQGATNTCPHCHTEQRGASDSEIEWYNPLFLVLCLTHLSNSVACHLIFRRITEPPVVVHVAAFRVRDSKEHKTSLPFSKSWLSTADIRPEFISELNEAQHISQFRRLRIVPAKELAHKCKLWALWDHESGDKTLEGIGGIRIRISTVRKTPCKPPYVSY